MNKVLSSETQYFFDLTDKQWWILPKNDNEWKELTNEEAYNIGLFKAVFSQKCNFIDTNLSQYDEAVSNLLKEFEDKFSLNKQKSLSRVSEQFTQEVNKILTKDFSNENEILPQLETKKLEQFPEFKNDKEEKTKDDSVVDNIDNNKENKDKDGTNCLDKEKENDKNKDYKEQINKPEKNVSKGGGTENILSQINNLIASTTQMKQMCKEKELSAQNKPKAPTVRSTARHLTYVNNGGLAGCLKTVAEERKKIGNTKKPVKQAQNTQLQEMIQRAKVMAAKTIDEVKEVEPVAKAKKEPQPKKTQLRSNAKKYTTVFGAAALKDLRMNHQLPDVKFEGSSDDDSEDENKN